MKNLAIAIISIFLLCSFLLCSCDESYKFDNTPIAHDDFARIQLESDICSHVISEYECLLHLKGRIQ